MGTYRIKRKQERKDLLASTVEAEEEGIRLDFLIGTKRHENLLFLDIENLLEWLDKKEQDYAAEENKDLVQHCQELRGDILGVLFGKH